ncbi:glyoxalase domain protein [Natronomonas pharaonis DSM 2160]|uniref:Glyoxalase domain protein n=1 Tax=Natronomonas pharaonis (strain ATCC 35678 / DSM 2160 / CIP 103997 / JCM 8858 / NBRC 14720 / NCIMB 2260 / Gabara) TaxID=348780 RepID=A0A1U7EXZ8_NATPD|nr:VOC family protein [Natronomonas pharaonis]CAI50065.1 glyoxalase domain protein [Natronomonas pharaonis DSM 2160]
MEHTPEHDVTAAPPESPVHTIGTDHMTVMGGDAASTIAFYRDLLGMPLVLEQPNLDAPELTHLFFDTGDGRILTFFVGEGRSPRPYRGAGNVHHLAFSIAPDSFEETKTALDDAGYGFNEFDRGAFHSLYTQDPSGLVVELVVEKYDFPPERRGEVLALAHEKRVEAGAGYVDDEHMQAALSELGLDSEPRFEGSAPTGAGVE